MWSRLGAIAALSVGMLALSIPLAAHAEDPVDLDGAYILDTVGAIAGDESRVLSALDSSYESSGIQLFVVYVDSFTAATDPAEWAEETAARNSLGSAASRRWQHQARRFGAGGAHPDPFRAGCLPYACKYRNINQLCQGKRYQ